MFVAVDIGNSDIVLGIRIQGEWKYTWRKPSNVEALSGEYEVGLRDFFLENEIEISGLDGVMISSVVPGLTDSIASMCERFFGCQSVILGPQMISQLSLKVNNPYEIGADLVGNAYAAFKKYPNGVIVVDFGTALTFTSVSGQGEILGVAIAPGVKTAMKSLSSNTAKLPEIPLEIPEKAIGTDTVTALQAGIMQGYVGLVLHMIAKTKEEIDSETSVVATGGLSFVFEPLKACFDEIDPMLTLGGLSEIFYDLPRRSRE